jgi:hypothetical protein
MTPHTTQETRIINVSNYRTIIRLIKMVQKKMTALITNTRRDKANQIAIVS